MVLSLTVLLALTAFASVDIDGLKFDLNTKDMTANVSTDNRFGVCKLETVVIPEEVNYEGETYKVVGINNYAFENNTDMVNLVIIPKLKTIPSGLIKNCANVKAVFVDLSEVTSIGAMSFNIYNKDDANLEAGREFYFYEPSSYDEENSENWVMIKEFDLTKVTNIGSSAFHNAKLDKVKIGNATIGIQTFRFSSLKEIEVSAEIIPDYFAANNPYLEKITIKNVKTISRCAFDIAKSVKEIYADFSQLTSVGDSAFVLCADYDDGQTLTQWYNLEGEKVVDLSKVTSFGGKAFASSNLGSARILWPESLSKLSDQSFRKCNIKQPIYINAADDAGITLSRWAMDGNSFPAVFVSGGVTTIDCYFEAQTNVVVLSENVKISRSDTFKKSGSKLYYTSLSADSATLNSNVEAVQITEGSIVNYGACGIVATVVVNSNTVTIGEVAHTLTSAINNAFCPVGKVLVTECDYCDYVTYTVEGEAVEAKEHIFDVANGAVVIDINYANFYEMGTHSIKCAACDATEDEETPSAPALIVFCGYSVSEFADLNGKYSITQGYIINESAYSVYVSYGNTLTAGLVAGVKNVVGDSPLKLENGEVVAVKPEKTILAEDRFFSHRVIEIKVKGLEEAHFDTELIFCLFLTDGENIYYLSDYTQSTTATAKTYNTAK